MQKSKHNLSAGCRPFPQARQTEAQREEDAFMHEHGGEGCRATYGVVEAFSACKRMLQILRPGQVFGRKHNQPYGADQGQINE